MRAWVVCLVLLACSPSLSFASASCGATIKPHAIYINGVWNDKASASKNRDNFEAYL